MYIKEATITRKFNLGNYQTMDISLTADVKVFEDIKKVLQVLEEKILEYYLWSISKDGVPKQ